MALHLVGETIDPKTAHLRAQGGELVQLTRGVYVDDAPDVQKVILGHAVRIARYLYPKAYLSSASAVSLAPGPDGRLFISGRRNQRTRLRGLEIVQNQAPPRPSTATAIVGDDLGELRVEVSSLRQRFLEAFRLRSEHAGAITTPMRAEMAARLIEEYATPEGAADAVWTLARENGWYREGEAAERFLLTRPDAAPAPSNKAALDFVVAWHRSPLGRLSHDGFEWRWRAADASAPPLVRQTTPGQLPAFIQSLLPEGWLAQVLKAQDEREMLRQGRRYMSNITIAEDRKALARLPTDVLIARLADFTDEGRFTGRYAGPAGGELADSFEANLANLAARAETPRLSGVQVKAPMTLALDGVLTSAAESPFTHILKPAGTGGFDVLPIVEWLGLELGRAAGFETPAAALVEMPDGMAPALLVERFDVRRGPKDRKRLALEDFCSVLDLPPAAKYDGTIERCARGLRGLSTDPAADLALLFRRALFAWLIADGDMHLKNLALLKMAEPGARAFASVRLAPLYDTVTTRVFPGLHADRMALKLNGRDDRLTRDDFLGLARTIGLPQAEAETSMAAMSASLADRAEAQRLPAFVSDWDRGRIIRDAVLGIVAGRTAALR